MFSDLDAGEIFVGRPVQEMTKEELFKYAYFMHEHVLGFKLVIDYTKDIAVLGWLLKTYKQYAGMMIKWIFSHDKGMVDNGETFTITTFNSHHKWWIDKIYAKVNMSTKPVIKQPNKTGFVGVKQLMEMAALSGASS